MSYKMMILIGLILINSMLLGAEKYAVLITGDYADSARVNYNGSWAIANGLDRDRRPMQEFWNDTFLIWEMLVFEKGYSDINVFVLFAGGMDYTHDPDANCPYWWDERSSPHILYPELSPITDFPADIASVNNLFNGLANGTGGFPQLHEDDFLVVWTFKQITLPNLNCKVKVFDANTTTKKTILTFLESI
jgi:hypothetical protein